jgi:hypothetical protein
MKTCQWCDSAFSPNVSYQIYCSAECRSHATKQKIADKYAIKRRNQLISKPKKCRSCSMPLSVYNDTNLCMTCLVDPKEVSKILKEIRGIADGKSQFDQPEA